MKIMARNIFFRSIAIVLCLLILNNPMQTYAELSPAQQRAFERGADYFDVDVACDTSIFEDTLANDADMDERLQYIYTWFRGKGLTNIQSAAAVGNISVESGGIPTRVQGTGVKTSQDPEAAGDLGWGLIQWTPGKKIIGIAKDAEVDLDTNPIYAMNTQLTIVLWHMKETSPTGAKNMLEGFTQTDIEDAVRYFEQKIEAAGKPAYSKRTARAKVALEKYESQVSAAYSDDSAMTLSVGATAAAEGAASSGCTPDGSAVNGNLATLAAAYAWPYEWRSGKSPDGMVSSPTQKTEEYDAATKRARKEGKWVGNDGIDCGGFVTRIVQNSFDPTYNTGNGGRGGHTGVQLSWLEDSDKWKEISAGQDATYYKPGDVGIYRNATEGHTLIVVGSITKYWWEGSNGKLYSPEKVTVTSEKSGTVQDGKSTVKVHRVVLASASNGKRAPMADKDETIGSTRYHWFRYAGSTSSI